MINDPMPMDFSTRARPRRCDKWHHDSMCLVQKLNDRAARYIETGRFSRALRALVKGLRLLNEIETFEEEAFSSSCSVGCFFDHHDATTKTATLDDCIHYSARRHQQERQFKRITKVDVEDVENQQRYIHTLPIRVPPNCRVSSDDLTKMTSFHLALAHHLSALDEPHLKDRRMQLQRVISLYQSTFEMHLQEDGGSSSVALAIILCNNIGEVHRNVQNEAKHAQCMEHLLSAMMFVLVAEQPTTNNHDENDPQRCLDFEGFFQNASSLILLNQGAPAA